MMYHSWDSQNAWLRQILAENCLYMNARTAEQLGPRRTSTGSGSSRTNGRIRCQLKTMEGVEADTVWTWNAIGKQAGAWGLNPDASEATAGLPAQPPDFRAAAGAGGRCATLTNSDPVTGQAAWFDLRVKITKAAPGETGVWPAFAALKPLPGDDAHRPTRLRYARIKRAA